MLSQAQVCEDCRRSTSGRCGRHNQVTIAVGPYVSGTPPMRVCPTCNGTGINPMANYLVCPKCNGERWLRT